MSYNIESQGLYPFIDGNSIRLPRFQRKKTWTPKQKFELCISIFKQYPIGVVIVNREGNSLSLLDGRQRREAIKELITNPCGVYEWAKRFIGFNKGDDERKINELFWVKVEDYLQRDKDDSSSDSENSQNNNDNNDEQDSVDLSEVTQPTFNSNEQKQGLDTLRKLILLCHNKDKQAFPNSFKFASHFVNRKTNEIRVDDLIDFLVKKFRDEENVTEQLFLEKYIGVANLDESEEDKCKADIHKHWQSIKESIDVLSQLDIILNRARIGVIELVNATPLDTQNIFSLVNKGGTKLKAEELLSAKPFWNEIVPDCNDETKTAVKQLYKKLAINCPPDVCRWDIVATIISRLEKNGSSLFFKKYDNNENNNKSGKKDNEDLKVEEVTIGFKILSAIFEGGISAKHVAKLEKKTSNIHVNNDVWSQTIDDVIDTLYEIEKSLKYSNLFKVFSLWKQNIMGLTSNSIALEFVAILYKLWIDLSCANKSQSSTACNNFRRYAIILLDKLIFEYINGMWKGSSDSKLASDLKSYQQRCESSISEGDWIKLIKQSCNGEIDFKPVMLYYDCAIRGIMPRCEINLTLDIDHIIPQIKLHSINNVSKSIIDGLGNRTLLYKSENVAKHDKYPCKINDPCILDSLKNYAGISEEQCKEYKSAKDIDKLIQDRINFFTEVFLPKRKEFLDNV